MAYAKVDLENRILEWSYEHLNGYDVEFSNGEYVDEVCVDGLEDFVIKDGKAIFSPMAEKKIKPLKQMLSDTDHIPAKIFEDFIETMVDGNVNMGSMKKFFNDVKEEYGEVLEARKTAREEINRIESEMATE